MQIILRDCYSIFYILRLYILNKFSNTANCKTHIIFHLFTLDVLLLIFLGKDLLKTFHCLISKKSYSPQYPIYYVYHRLKILCQ